MEDLLNLIVRERGCKIEKGTLNYFFISDKGIYGVTDKDFTIFKKAKDYNGDSEWFANKYTEVTTVVNNFTNLDVVKLCRKLNKRFNPISYEGVKIFAPFRINENYEIEVDEDTIIKTVLAMNIFCENITEAIRNTELELIKGMGVKSPFPINERIHFFPGNLIEISLDISLYDGSYNSIKINY